MELIRMRDPSIPLKTACAALGVPRSTAQRRLRSPVQGPRRPRAPSHRKLAVVEEQGVLATLHSERFQDQTPRQVYAELLNEGTCGAALRWCPDATKHRGPVTLGMFAVRWLKDRERRKIRDVTNDRGRLHKHVLPALGENAIADIRPRDIRDLVRD